MAHTTDTTQKMPRDGEEFTPDELLRCFLAELRGDNKADLAVELERSTLGHAARLHREIEKHAAGGIEATINSLCLHNLATGKTTPKTLATAKRRWRGVVGAWLMASALAEREDEQADDEAA